MPSRLSISRPRTSSKSTANTNNNNTTESNDKIGSSSIKSIDLEREDLEHSEGEEGEESDWEPKIKLNELKLNLNEIYEEINLLEKDLNLKNKNSISGRTIVVVHSLPYVCTLHPTTSHSTSLDPNLLPTPIKFDNTLVAPISSSSTSLPVLEIQQGDPAIRPRALHSPSSSRHINFKPIPPTSFPSPATSLAPSSHPPCPPSRAPSPDSSSNFSLNNSPSTTPNPESQSSSLPSSYNPSSNSSEPNQHPSSSSPRWILHPRRGHAALNSGLKSLSNRPLLVVGRPDDLMRSDGQILGQGELGLSERRDLERGLKGMNKVGKGSTTANGESVEGTNGGGESEVGIGCVPVWLDDVVHTNFYEGMCKTFLWPIFHYLALPDSLDKKTEELAWKAYFDANLVYAKKVAEVYREGDLVWIHDYHLLLVPKMLRDILAEKKIIPYISLFLHCPFPSSEYFRCLPRREPLLDGILGCNLVIFQTHSYARHFLSSCVRVMGYEAGLGGVDAKGSITRVAHCPIGIDVDNVEVDRTSPGVGPKIQALKKLYAGKKIIVGRDKLDPTKGVLPKLRAFEKFLQDYPQWSQKVVLIQVTSPSSGDSPALATKVSELVDQINGLYGTLEFQPVHHYHQTIERDEYFALLSVADLALITSIRDGMNTTSMEYIICQAESKGTLIVSEFTGVSATLSKAIKVNPWDLGGVARAIDSCLTMSLEERESRHSTLHSIVKSQTASVWAATNILKLLESLQGEQASQNTPPLDREKLVRKYKEAGKRLLLFDYDGTLTPIVKNPSAALPSPLLLTSLQKLTSDPKNVVYIISGRDGEFLEEHLGHIKNLGMSAEHGCFLKSPGSGRGKEEWVSLTSQLDMNWKEDVLRIFRYYEARTQGSFVEVKVSSVTFHYRNADPVFGLFQAKECQAMLESMQASLPIDVLVGKKNVEVRPAHTNKGEIVQRLLYQYPDTEFCMCAGDDKTDEDMFHAMARIASSTTTGETPIIAPPESLTLFPSLVNDLPPEAKSRVATSNSSTTGEDSNSTEGISVAVNGGGGEKGEERGEGEEIILQSVKSKLDPESMWMIAIEASETGNTRMTMANSILNDPEAMIDLLAVLAEI